MKRKESIPAPPILPDMNVTNYAQNALLAVISLVILSYVLSKIIWINCYVLQINQRSLARRLHTGICDRRYIDQYKRLNPRILVSYINIWLWLMWSVAQAVCLYMLCTHLYTHGAPRGGFSNVLAWYKYYDKLVEYQCYFYM